MPLRDHFRPPLDDETQWEGFHGGWPMMIVASLTRKLPPRYVAAPRVHLGTSVEIDVAAYEKDSTPTINGNNGNGGIATAVWAPPKPTLAVTTDLPALDEYEVKVYDTKRGRRLVAAIELVSPANKDRPEHRTAFVAKCIALLENRVYVAIVDLVTTRHFNLYSELLETIKETDPCLGPEPPSIYAAACNARKTGEKWLLEGWANALALGKPLPTLPLCLAEDLVVPLDLEESYEETCRILRIP
ncbi:MAG TPA: DUF4058 family protein [Gemmataceae bacterium]|nr:DUF4058 family protein [Gemmataceae bacterium]